MNICVWIQFVNLHILRIYNVLCIKGNERDIDDTLFKSINVLPSNKL